MANAFTTWIDTFFQEKGIDTDAPIEVEGAFGTNYMRVQNVIDAIKGTSSREQQQIKTTFVKIDFANGDPLHFVRHLAQAIAV